MVVSGGKALEKKEGRCKLSCNDLKLGNPVTPEGALAKRDDDEEEADDSRRDARVPAGAGEESCSNGGCGGRTSKSDD